MKQFKITKEWLEANGACEGGRFWFLSQKSTTIRSVVVKLIEQRNFDWANWTITKVMTHKQNVQYACFSALQCLEFFEKLYPNDKRPRLAIEAAMKWADDPTEENKSAARSAARAAARSAEAWQKLLMFGLRLVLGKVVDKVLSK